MTRRKPRTSSAEAPNGESDTTAGGRVIESSSRRPNLLLIMADQHRRNAMGAAGDPIAKTPNLDRLAAQSTRFTKAYCTNPICAPSRASMLTGRWSHNIDSNNNGNPLSPRHKTIADHFNAAGYLTALVGKMHFVDAQTHGFQYKLEFNDWLQVLGPRAIQYAIETMYPNAGAGLPEIPGLWKGRGDPWKDHRTFDGRLGPVAVGRSSEMAEEDHFETFVTEESIRFLETHGKDSPQPFFMVSSFLKPHDPFMPAKRFADEFEASKMPLSPTWDPAYRDSLPESVLKEIESSWVTPELLEAKHARQRVAAYYGNLMQTDDCVGRILDTLSRLNLDRNTIVIYTSDHGEMLGDLGLWNKFQFYEGSCGVPLMVRMPQPKTAVCPTPVSLVSLAATMAELCSVPIRSPIDGPSFVDVIKDSARSAERDPIFAEYDIGGGQEKYMILDGEWKYTLWMHDRPELYNLRHDSLETENLAGREDHQAVVDRLRRRLLRWHRPQGL